ncbi:hypothetical protein NKH54_18130 [Mesorhizobium sp. M1004]|uniref:hypothetical protein n=1 Tax=Mesorhizobium sp. M1004 TaxID=2957046 RepID=UPI00333BE1E4
MDFMLMVNIAGGILLAIAIPSVCLVGWLFYRSGSGQLRGESCDNEKPATVSQTRKLIF